MHLDPLTNVGNRKFWPLFHVIWLNYFYASEAITLKWCVRLPHCSAPTTVLPSAYRCSLNVNEVSSMTLSNSWNISSMQKNNWMVCRFWKNSQHATDQSTSHIVSHNTICYYCTTADTVIAALCLHSKTKSRPWIVLTLTQLLVWWSSYQYTGQTEYGYITLGNDI